MWKKLGKNPSGKDIVVSLLADAIENAYLRNDHNKLLILNTLDDIRKNHKSKSVKIAADEIYNEFYQAYIETQKLKERADSVQDAW